jgi:NADH-quinone oxidoreductase subunit A
MLLEIVSQNQNASFFPLLIQLLVVVGFVVASMWGTHKLGPKRATADKLTPFESGIESVGNARSPFSIKYFLVAILFVLFDVEVVFMYPWAVNFRQLGAVGLWDMFLFIGLFLTGFFYILKKGALNWE